jgi:hypothetical protein
MEILLSNYTADYLLYQNYLKNTKDSIKSVIITGFFNTRASQKDILLVQLLKPLIDSNFSIKFLLTKNDHEFLMCVKKLTDSKEDLSKALYGKDRDFKLILKAFISCNSAIPDFFIQFLDYIIENSVVCYYINNDNILYTTLPFSKTTINPVNYELLTAEDLDEMSRAPYIPHISYTNTFLKTLIKTDCKKEFNFVNFKNVIFLGSNTLDFGLTLPFKMGNLVVPNCRSNYNYNTTHSMTLVEQMQARVYIPEIDSYTILNNLTALNTVKISNPTFPGDFYKFDKEQNELHSTAVVSVPKRKIAHFFL